MKSNLCPLRATRYAFLLLITVNMNDPKYTEKGDPDHKLSSSGDQTPANVGHGAQIAIDAPAVNKNGIKLHPQPTSDALDPLNWSKSQKHVILAIVMFKYVF